ncbi:MAG: hypothetical protein WD492_10150 [Alkalispirochaeta sp.]
MTLAAILLVLLSSFVHAGWNLLSKRSSANGAFYSIAAIAGFLAMVPLVVLWRDTFLGMPPVVWLYLVPTGLFQGIYFVGLAGAYRTGDMSVAYPVARAVPVLLVPVVAILAGTGEIPSPSAIAGMVVVAAGLLTVGLKTRGEASNPAGSRTPRGTVHTTSQWILYAVLAGLGTTGYSVVDDAALAAFRTAMSGSTPRAGALAVEMPLIYSGFQALATVVFLSLFGSMQQGPRKFVASLREIPVRSAAATGVAIIIAYGLVLLAYGLVDNVGYVVAFRQVSLPIGTALAVLLLKEQVTTARITGTALILAGLVLVGLAR